MSHLVHIPDLSLRAAIEISLGKSIGDPINVQEMQLLKDLEIKRVRCARFNRA